MALTDIARKLKETFPGFDVDRLKTEVAKFRALYGDAESIRLGEMDYIVINGVYRSSDQYQGLPDSISPLFYNSIKNNFAIIDAETSSTLIDEVYSRVTYMQRDCMDNARTPTATEVQTLLQDLVGEGDTVVNVRIPDDTDEEARATKRANIFQCQLIKDTGVSASPDVYSFMLKNGVIKDVPDNAIKKIHDAGTVKMLDDSNMEELQSHEKAIQEAVFEKYINSDIDIQSISVKSIFEIKMKFCNIHLMMQSSFGKTRLDSIYNTTYLLSEKNEFDALNKTIHVCNCCGHDLVDSRDERMIYKLHTNMDAYDNAATEEAFEIAKKKSGKDTKFDHMVYAVGCEDCLEECPCCHTWHFNYKKMVGSKAYDRVTLAPGREFIKGIRSFDFNYCACREGIEWVYDERSGGETEHDVIPIADLVFINCANEKLAGYEEYIEYYERERERVKPEDAIAERELARQTLSRFKNYLSGKFETNVTGIRITSKDKCHECSMCGGVYHGMLTNDRCAVCSEIFDENRHMVTRVDGVVFMLHGGKKKKTISKYIVTRLGNLKRISSKLIIEELDVDPLSAESEISGTAETTADTMAETAKSLTDLPSAPAEEAAQDDSVAV